MTHDATPHGLAKDAILPRRAANEIDFWRGFALVSIFINHIPGIFFEAWTYRNLGVSDSAELFVFLAGFSLRFLSESRAENLTTVRLFMRLEARAFTLYAAQILITVVALAMLAAGALYFETPLLLQWNNAQAFFQEPVPTIIGIAALTHQLGYFDILPLYIVLMICAPFIVLLHRRLPSLLLPLSFALWVATLVSEVNLPTWPVEGRWYFNPLAWQFDFVSGFVVARATGLGSVARRHLTALRVIGAMIVAAGLATRLFDWSPNAFTVPEPHLVFVFNKTFLTPARYLHLLGLVAFFAGAFDRLMRFDVFRPVGAFFALLGRNSLHVFCAGSLLSLSGQMARFALEISIATDLMVIGVGIACLTLVAWLNEWRSRL
ncbi:MAG: OpgC domain-containing protein [Beijerinckiaceae bacterium]|nr:OpgC domain-containing protein [Beijerinckiaceae bacterium]